MKWTNPTLRAHLGEHGFLPDGDSVHNVGLTYTTFVRGNDELTLVEHDNNEEPQVFQDGAEVDVTNIGHRNEQIQHDKLRGD